MKRVQLNYKELENFSLQNGDLLFGRRSLVEAGAGKCSIVFGIEEPLTFESSIIRVRLNNKIANPRFYFYYFKSPQGRGSIYSIVTGTNVKGIRGTELGKLKVLYLPITAQDTIVRILSVYDNLIENNRRRIQLLEQSARLLYREWFVHLRFPGHEHVRIIDGVPKGWEKETIQSLGQVITGKTPLTKEEDNYGSEIPFIKTPDMHGMPIVIETEQSLSEKGANSQVNKFIPKGSIMVSCIGTVGVVSLNGCRAQTNQQINTVIPRKECLRYYSYFAISDLKSKLEAMGGGATMPNINKTKFESLQVVVPSDSVLNIFDDFCQQAFKQIQNLLEQDRKLKGARDILLPRLMNGVIPV